MYLLFLYMKTIVEYLINRKTKSSKEYIKNTNDLIVAFGEEGVFPVNNGGEIFIGGNSNEEKPSLIINVDSTDRTFTIYTQDSEEIFYINTSNNSWHNFSNKGMDIKEITADKDVVYEYTMNNVKIIADAIKSCIKEC